MFNKSINLKLYLYGTFQTKLQLKGLSMTASQNRKFNAQYIKKFVIFKVVDMLVCTCIGFHVARVVIAIPGLCIVTGGNQQVSQNQQLVICELLLVLLPVVVMSPPEVRQRLLYGHLESRTCTRSH